MTRDELRLVEKDRMRVHRAKQRDLIEQREREYEEQVQMMMCDPILLKRRSDWTPLPSSLSDEELEAMLD